VDGFLARIAPLGSVRIRLCLLLRGVAAQEPLDDDHVLRFRSRVTVDCGGDRRARERADHRRACGAGEGAAHPGAGDPPGLARAQAHRAPGPTGDRAAALRRARRRRRLQRRRLLRARPRARRAIEAAPDRQSHLPRGDRAGARLLRGGPRDGGPRPLRAAGRAARLQSACCARSRRSTASTARRSPPGWPTRRRRRSSC
jgi:hypothetical protein